MSEGLKVARRGGGVGLFFTSKMKVPSAAEMNEKIKIEIKNENEK